MIAFQIHLLWFKQYIHIQFKIQFIFEFLLQTQIQNDNYFNIKAKKTGYFSQKFQKQDEKPSEEQMQHEKSENYILKNFNISIKVKLDLLEYPKVEINITTNDIVIFLKQNQVRLLIKSLKELANYNSERPKIRPLEIPLDNQLVCNGAMQWWKYIIDKVITLKKLSIKMKQKSLVGFLRAAKYRRYYTKKRINSRLKENEVYFLENFEMEFPLQQLIILRKMAINNIVENKEKLNSSNFNHKYEAEKWFYSIDQYESFDQIINEKIQQEQSHNNSNSKSKKQQITFNIELDIFSFHILVEENEMLKDIKNLHYQAKLFKNSFRNNPKLQEQILTHIKKTFLHELSKKGLKQFQENLEKDKNNIKKINSSKILEGQNWNFNNLKNSKKLLLHLHINNFLLIYSQDNTKLQQIQFDLDSFQITDMHSLNKHYNILMQINEGIQIVFKNQSSKNLQQTGTKDNLYISNQNLDINIPVIKITLTKPFVERCNQIISKDQKMENNLKEKQNVYKQEEYFNNFLIQKDIEKTCFTNISFQIGKINVFIPTNYQLQSEMLALQIKKIQILKREHDTLINKEVYDEQNLRIKSASQIQMDLFNQIQEPLIIAIDCFKILIVKSYDWEEKYNIFLYNYKKVEQKSSKRLNTVEYEQEDVKEQVKEDQNEKTEDFTEKNAGEQEIILESLSLQIKIENTYAQKVVGSIIYLDNNKKINLQKKITPQSQICKIQLPFLIINLSIKQLQTIIYLFQLWSIKGYNFQTLINEWDEKQNLQFQQNDEKNRSFMTSQLKKQIEQHVHYPDNIKEMLKTHFFNTLEVFLEGFQINLLVCPNEKIQKIKDQFFHSNNILSITGHNVTFLSQSKFFENFQNIQLNEFIIQNQNCCQQKIQEKIKQLSTKQLSESDYQMIMLKECPKNKKINQFLSINNNNNSSSNNSDLKINFNLIKKAEGNIETINESFDQDMKYFFNQINQQINDKNKVNQKQQNENENQIFVDLLKFEEENLMIKNKNNEKCSLCFEKNSQKKFLILNFQQGFNKFQTQQEDILPDISVSIISYNEQYFFAYPKFQGLITPLKINLELKSTILTLDPVQIAYLKGILDITSIYINQRIEDYKEFMQTKGFTATFQEQKTQKNNQKKLEENNLDENNKVILSNIRVEIPSLSVIMLHNSSLKSKDQNNKLLPVFVLNMKDILFNQKNFENDTQMKFISKNISLFDVGQFSGLHTQILGNIENGQNELSLEFNIKNTELINQNNNYSTYIGVKIKNSKIVFLKKNTIELQTYILKFLMNSIQNKTTVEDINFMKNYSRLLIKQKHDLIYSLKTPKAKQQQQKFKENKTDQEQVYSDSRIEIAIIDSITSVYRNSLSEKDGLFLKFSKIGFWFTGKWGMEFIQNGLIDKGLHFFENETNQTQQEVFSQSNSYRGSFQDVISSFNEAEFIKIQEIYKSQIQTVRIQKQQQTSIFNNQQQFSNQQYNSNQQFNSNQQNNNSNDNLLFKNQENLNNIQLLENNTQTQQLNTEANNQSQKQQFQKVSNNVIEVQRIFLWDLQVYSTEEYLNKVKYIIYIFFINQKIFNIGFNNQRSQKYTFSRNKNNF
ncbi:hypothetical protein IMG5_132670 [Ichthyophthirius multifiliis]|uniref:Uncharacterized protein n=1 Tax=Ichthyophthirius multifiliis TaxID=5932 RepID=G0QWJ1_ICHMU|nr:hypothetical protein IMG5_132670 [Ichthyophthirius multifiliis]EGR30420.1 hypothetical protein IMG5_132670 [Ichthyophthirius multifiliis]|eukprot:XP_004032007.1 hypothetical protein IMG5_132670 [Ichthyophthirius multifiliis]